MKPRIPPPIVLAPLVVCLLVASLAHAQNDKTTPELFLPSPLMDHDFLYDGAPDSML